MAGISSFGMYNRLNTTSSLLSNFNKPQSMGDLTSQILTLNNSRISLPVARKYFETFGGDAKTSGSTSGTKTGTANGRNGIVSAKDQARAEELNAQFDSLKTASSALRTGTANSVWNTKGYNSSDSSVMTITGGTQTPKDGTKVEVDQLASAQTTVISGLRASDSSLSGDNSIAITANGKTQNFRFQFLPTRSDAQNLQDIAKKINHANLGVTASYTNDNGKAGLTLKANRTGVDAGFEVTMGGRIAEQTQLRTEAASNAVFSVNGTEYTSSSNEVSLGYGVKATLKGTGEAAIQKNSVNQDQVMQGLANFVKQYNSTLDLVNANKNMSISMKHTADSFGATKYTQSTLEKLGITADSKGRLSLDTGKAMEKLKENPYQYQQALGGSGGFASLTENKIDSGRKAVNELAGAGRIGSSDYYNRLTYQRNSLNAIGYGQSSGMDSFMNFFL